MGRSRLLLVWYLMSHANLHDSVNGKPLMVGIAKDSPRQIVYRMVSEWFREVPDDPNSVMNGLQRVLNGFGHI
jgi:hypothetical protein